MKNNPVMLITGASSGMDVNEILVRPTPPLK
jgi:NADP-dependent 3-hydroxy acid dehydrogenase YdfG